MLSQNSQQSSLELKTFSTFAIRRGPYCVLILSAVRQFMNIDRDIQGWVNPRPVSHCAVSMFSQMSLKVFNSPVYPSLDNSPRMYASCSSWAAVGLSSPLTQPCLFALPRDNTDSWGPLLPFPNWLLLLGFAETDPVSNIMICYSTDCESRWIDYIKHQGPKKFQNPPTFCQ